MKFVIALLVAAVSADAPAAFNEPPFAVSTHPAAAGLIQLNSNQRFLDIEMSEEPAVAVVEDEAPAKKEAKAEVLAPEKVHTLDPKIAKSHTTFYNRQ